MLAVFYSFMISLGINSVIQKKHLLKAALMAGPNSGECSSFRSFRISRYSPWSWVKVWIILCRREVAREEAEKWMQDNDVDFFF